MPYPVALDERAPSDRDLAQLATLLGMRAISWDLDLRAYGLAEPFDVQVALAIGELASGKCAAFMGLGLSAEATVALVRLARWGIDQARRQPILAFGILVGLAVVVACARRNEQLVQKVTAVEWRPLLTQLLEATGQLMAAYHELTLRMPAAPQIAALLPMGWNVGRLLATAPGPVSAREIAAQLEPHGIHISEDTAREILRADPQLFVRSPSGQWQLGGAAQPASATAVRDGGSPASMRSGRRRRA